MADKPNVEDVIRDLLLPETQEQLRRIFDIDSVIPREEDWDVTEQPETAWQKGVRWIRRAFGFGRNDSPQGD